MRSKKKLDTVRFAPRGKHSFIETVTERVNAYFKSNHISPYANTSMWVKTVFMLMLYFVPYFFIITGIASNVWVFFACWFLMAWGMSGIGTSVMHDANHGTYSANKKVNNFISHILEIIGGYAVTWRIQHNVLHHTYTIIAALDEDIEGIKYLRLSPCRPWYPVHRYQHEDARYLHLLMPLPGLTW